MSTPFDLAIEAIRKNGYHNHRKETHSDTVSEAIIADLLETCAPLQQDVADGVVKVWYNEQAPGDRLRKVDLFIGEPKPDGSVDISKVRIALENKSVITAHRNRTNRFDDLKKILAAIHSARPEALLIATVLIGMCDRVLNVPDEVHKFYRDREDEFQSLVLPRLSSGDQTLWDQFNWAISRNRPNDPARTLEMFRQLPTRKAGHTHVEGYDAVLCVPVVVDNVNPPSLPRPNALDVDVDTAYRQMLEQICAAYTARWHM